MIANSVYGIYKKDQVANINRIESERKLNILKDKEERLQTEIAKLKTSRGIEEELRSKFQVTKNGEEVLVVVDDPVSATDASQTPRDGDGIWGKFLKLIGF
ncbi:MAG: hypothetical protein HY225_03140 [Candidatus Vogelbacteria bacterium]|nr:hypothetical protein [Candidatus Vogelbacteria bacterium]